MMGLVFIVNICVMIHNNILKFKLKQKKKRVQQRYEARFKNHLEIVQKLKDDKEEMVSSQMEKRLSFYMKMKFEVERDKIDSNDPNKLKLKRAGRKIPKLKMKLEPSLDRIDERSGEEDSKNGSISSEYSSSSSSSSEDND